MAAGLFRRLALAVLHLPASGGTRAAAEEVVEVLAGAALFRRGDVLGRDGGDTAPQTAQLSFFC
jgi:hypothetical protein